MPRSRRRPASRSRWVTLTSDFGAAYAAQVRAVLARSAPRAQVVELSHELRPHDVAEGSFLLAAMAGGFPGGTIHLAVVDPGVGGDRVPLIVRCADGSFLVGPDNGLLAPLASRLGGGVPYRIEPDRLRSAVRVGTTFDGRDVFAPVAAALARGETPERLGRRLRSFRPSPIPSPRVSRSGARGVLVHLDRFGNAITNIPAGAIPAGTRTISVALGRRRSELPWTDRYVAVAPGSALALGSSFGTVELALHRDSIARRWRLSVGGDVTVRWRSRRITGK